MLKKAVKHAEDGRATVFGYYVNNSEILGRGFAWLDTGTMVSLSEASYFLFKTHKREGIEILHPKKLHILMVGWIKKNFLNQNADTVSHRLVSNSC